MRWPLTIYTERFIPKNAAACACGPLIFIRPKYREDHGLYMHELEHVKQSFAGLIVFHVCLYLLAPKYRLWCEVQAYKAQAKHYPDDRIPKFARFIALYYKLDVSIEQAEKLLRK
jgi:hypothetical protein